MIERRHDWAKRREVEDVLRQVRKRGIHRKILISQQREVITVKEIMAVIHQNNHCELMIVRDERDKIWEIPIRPELHAEGAVAESKVVAPGTELVVELRLVHSTVPETIAYLLQHVPIVPES